MDTLRQWKAEATLQLNNTPAEIETIEKGQARRILTLLYLLDLAFGISREIKGGLELHLKQIKSMQEEAERFDIDA